MNRQFSRRKRASLRKEQRRKDFPRERRDFYFFALLSLAAIFLNEPAAFEQANEQCLPLTFSKVRATRRDAVSQPRSIIHRNFAACNGETPPTRPTLNQRSRAIKRKEREKERERGLKKKNEEEPSSFSRCHYLRLY